MQMASSHSLSCSYLVPFIQPAFFNHFLLIDLKQNAVLGYFIYEDNFDENLMIETFQ